MQQPESEPRGRQPSPYSKGERRGSAIAHASALLVGVPVLVFLLRQPEIAFLLNPVVSYLIARYFRRRSLPWGAFQAMQASVAQLVIVGLLFIAKLVSVGSPTLAPFLFAGVAILFLYTLWGAWDTLLGYNFRYIIIGRFLDRVSEANLERAQTRRGSIRPRRPDLRPGETRKDQEQDD